MLEDVYKRPSFSLHKSADDMIIKFKPKNSPKKTQTKKPKSWRRCVGKTKQETCQLFAAMLQLANNGNFSLESDWSNAGNEAYVDSLKLQLLTSQRKQDRFDDMEV